MRKGVGVHQWLQKKRTPGTWVIHHGKKLCSTRAGLLNIQPSIKLQRLNLVKSRRGQGVYRQNLERIETDRAHLRASHIKPWAKCSDEEKLDGFNGLLLAPHIDHLFDRGYISFSDAGEVLVAEELEPEILRSWGIVLPKDVGAFRQEQRKYLEYHRAQVFRKRAQNSG